MKSKIKLIWFGAAGAVVIAAAVLAIMLCLGGDSSRNEPLSKEQAQQQLELALAAADTASDENSPAFLKELDNRNGYEILTLSKSEEIYLATVCVYAPDVYAVARKLDNESGELTQGELAEQILNEIKSCELVEKEVQLVYRLQDGQYVPVLTEEFVDAYYGGVLRLYEDALEQLTGMEGAE